jgi:hypothetical protein
MTVRPRRSRGRSHASTSPDDPVERRHQAFIRSLPCLGCGKPAPSECAYVGRIAGLAAPVADRYLVPLCGPATVWQDCCHSRKHYRGAARFWSALGINAFDLALQLWRVSGDLTAGVRTVMRARQAAMAFRQGRGGREIKGSSSGCALHSRAGLRDRLRPPAMLIPPMSSELRSLSDSRP